MPVTITTNESIIGHTQLLLPPTLTVAFRSFELRIGEPFPNERFLRKKDCGYRANNFQLGKGCAIHGSKDLNAMFNVGGNNQLYGVLIL